MSEPSDIISSEQPTRPSWRRPREASLASAGVRTTAMTAALTLVVAAGVATAAYRSTSSSTSPTSLIPANAFAVASFDFSLPNGQEGALDQLLGRFPAIHLPGDGSLKDRVFRALMQSSDPPVDYDADVKPWLGDHMAVAGWMDDGHPKAELVMESRDDAAARKHGPAAFGNDTAYSVHNGYVVVSDHQSDIDDAIKAATQSSLDDSAHYTDDVNRLPSGEAITAWVDGPEVKQVLQQMFGFGPAGTSALGGFELMGDFGLGQIFKGRLSLGLHVTDDYVQLDMRNIGGTTATRSAPASMLTSLPAGTIAGLEIGDPGSVIDAIDHVVQAFGGIFAGSEQSCTATAIPIPAPTGQLSGISRRHLLREIRQSIPPGTANRREIIRHVLREHRRAVARLHQLNKGTFAPAPQSCTTTTPPTPPVDPGTAIQQALGISFPDDVKTILGDRAVVAFGGLEVAGLPDIAIRSHPIDLSAAQSLAATMSKQLGQSTPLNVDVRTAGDDLVLSSSSTYGEEVAKAGSLGDQAQVKTALGDVPASVQAAGYVDLSRVWPLIGAGVPDAIQHLKALGFWATGDGDVQTSQLRLVIN